MQYNAKLSLLPDSKFSKGLLNKKANDNVEKLTKAHDIYKNDKLDTKSKLNQFNNLLAKSDVANTSNGHVPAGYQAASSQGATIIPTGSTSTYENKNKNKNKKAKKPNNQWNKNKNKNKGRKRK